MNDQGQCETCESLAHELAEEKRENEQLWAILSNESFEEMQTAAFNTSQAGTIAPQAKSDKGLRYIKTQIAANDRIFAQRQALVELPLKIEQMKTKIENTKTRTALTEADTRLKEEKIKDLQAGRLLKESQTRLLEAAALALDRYANTGNMVDADFEVINQLKEIGLKIPAKVSAKKLKQTNGAG